MNKDPIRERIEARLRTFPGDLQPLADSCGRYLKYCSAAGSDASAPMWVAHRPWVGQLAYLITLFPGAKKSWFAKHASMWGVRIPTELRFILSCVNGFHAFGLSLYGMVMMPFHQPLDIGTANQHWVREFQNHEGGFHFGSRHYSHTEDVGYFLHPRGKITARLKNGDLVGEYVSFRDFLQEELAASEELECASTPAEWWH